MRLYNLFLWILLPYAVIAYSASLPPTGSDTNRAVINLGRVFLRRSSRSNSNPLRIASSPRHLRLSRYIQESDQQQHEVQQEHTHDDAEIMDNDLEQLMDQAFGQQRLRSNPFSTPVAPPGGSSGSQTPAGPISGSYTQFPQRYDGSSTQKPMQLKEDNLSQINQPPVQPFNAFETDDEPPKFTPPSPSMQTYAPQRKQPQVPTQRPQPHPQQQKQQLPLQVENGGGMGGGVDDEFKTFTFDNGGDIGELDGDFDGGMNNIDGLKNVARGEPEKDFPIFSDIPETNFKCSDHQYPGYYADVEAQCQVFHICQPDGRHNAFLCPNATIFSQRHFVCVWWYEFDCADTEKYYDLNAELYKESPEQFKSMAPSLPAITDATGRSNLPAGDFDVGDMGPSAHDGPSYSGRNGGFTLSSNGGGYSPGSYTPSSTARYGPNGAMPTSPPEGEISQINQQHIDGFAIDTPMTTTSPLLYSNGQSRSQTKGSSASQNNQGVYSRPASKLMSRYEPASYGGEKSMAVTQSPLGQDRYETTPYNLDAALGEEIHSETPLIESLPLTTILPHVEKAVDMAIANRGSTVKPQLFGTSNGFNGGGRLNGGPSTKQQKPSWPTKGNGNGGNGKPFLMMMKNNLNGKSSAPSYRGRMNGNDNGYGSSLSSDHISSITSSSPSTLSSLPKKSSNNNNKSFGTKM